MTPPYASICSDDPCVVNGRVPGTACGCGSTVDGVAALWHNRCVHPVLFTLFETRVHAYAFITTVAYVLGTIVGVTLAHKDGRGARDILDGSIAAVLGGLLGSKVFHVLFEAAGHQLSDGTIAKGVIDLVKDDPWHWARLFEPGYVFYGGMIGASLVMYVFCVRRAFPDKGAVGDYAMPGVLFGIFIGRIGCFLAGCCYGAPTTWAWGVRFPASHETHGTLVHPVQLLDSSFGLLALIAMALLWKKRRFSGEAMCAITACYAVFRFGTEMLRADGDRGVWLLSLSTSQIVALCTLPLVLFVWWRCLRLVRAGKLRDPRTPIGPDTP